jgi:hypothetical protein
MADQSIDKREQYVAFATHCLQLAKVAGDSQSRTVLREMAAEWLNLAEAASEANGASQSSERTTAKPSRRLTPLAVLPSTCGCAWLAVGRGISKMRILGIVALCAALGGCAASREEVSVRVDEHYIGQNVDMPATRQQKITFAEMRAARARDLKGWLLRHESGTYVKFTPAGAEMFA